ncbi:MAG: hypothetical protein A3D95_12810 [Betaproteobacteria bacterium RIFCSPHIGHO2_12_FULL_69_13]|nr:MAG: hypothetical protein A3D95_12810 [Betaproteobacteria bacterium RIFCSPHIGHO2_12_FULL_69_13]OGA65290.1 MAG: hypothetical protein A3G83_07325 [Betaproteobacteria bacterium RIFCSPLOWO2_12_FULL_68_20]
MAKECTHRSFLSNNPTPSGQGCAECLRTGQKWAQLRMCLTCGHVGCCDSSPGKHATAHFQETKHPAMKSFPEGKWAWCYVDETYL